MLYYADRVVSPAQSSRKTPSSQSSWQMPSFLGPSHFRSYQCSKTDPLSPILIPFCGKERESEWPSLEKLSIWVRPHGTDLAARPASQDGEGGGVSSQKRWRLVLSGEGMGKYETGRSVHLFI